MKQPRRETDFGGEKRRRRLDAQRRRKRRRRCRFDADAKVCRREIGDRE